MTETDPNTSTALILTERIAASPDVIFDFLVDPEKMLRWMGTEVDIDPVPGGKFWLNANGSDVAVGTYLEIDPPHRVVFTWGWDGSTDVPPASSTVTITLLPDGDATTVELRHDDLPGGANDQHREGWSYFMPRLTAAAEGRDPGPNVHVGETDQ